MSHTRRLFVLPRIVMRPSSLERSGLVQLGRYNYTSAQSGLCEHRHRNSMEICFLVKGRQTYRVGGNLFSLRGGDVFVTFPNEAHCTGGMPEEKGILYWIILAMPEKAESFLGLPHREGQALARALGGLARRHFRGSSKMKDHLDGFTRIYHERGGPLRSCALANHVVAFLLDVLASGQAGAAPPPARSLTPVLDHISGHPGEELGIPTLAAMAGLSEARFKARFRQETGIPPGEFVLRVRIENAKRQLLKRKKSITEIAFDLGFSSSQYFATVFLRFTGMSPTGFLQTQQSITGNIGQSSV